MGTPRQVRRPGLLEHHRRELRQSGLDDATIRAAGIYTESDPAVVAQMLGCKLTTAKGLVPAIVYSYGDGYARIKPDSPRKSKGKVVKYESPARQPNRVYIPPQSTHDLPDASVPLLITEGEKKALCAAQRGYCTVGLVGVYGWKRKNYEGLLPDLASIPLRDRDVIIVYDSDVRENPQVQAAESTLAIQLQRHGARVQVARIADGPLGTNGLTRKVGLDDYIVAYGDQAFAQLIEAAQPPANLPPPRREDARKLDPADTVAQYLARGEVEGVATLRRFAGSWYRWSDGADIELSDEEVQSQYARGFLNPIARNVTRGVLQDHITQLRAQAAVGGVPQLPAWVGPDPNGWNVTDVMVCVNGIVHLPSIGTGSQCMIPHTPRLFGATPIDIEFRADARLCRKTRLA